MWNAIMHNEWHAFNFSTDNLRFTKTRNSGIEIANVNILYDNIVHALQIPIDWCINSATDRRGYTQLNQIQWNNAMQRPLHRSRSFKVTDFGTNRKLIYDVLLWLILTYLLCTVYGWLLVKFSLARGECLTLTLSMGWSPANIAINDISLSLKTRFFGLRCRKCWCIFSHFYVIRPKSYTFGEVMLRLGLYAVQGHRVWYQSKAHMRLPISG